MIIDFEGAKKIPIDSYKVTKLAKRVMLFLTSNADLAKQCMEDGVKAIDWTKTKARRSVFASTAKEGVVDYAGACGATMLMNPRHRHPQEPAPLLPPDSPHPHSPNPPPPPQIAGPLVFQQIIS